MVFQQKGIALGGAQRIVVQFHLFISTQPRKGGGFFHPGLNNSIKAARVLKDLNGIRQTQRQNL
jgi:hypothetical protein